MRDNFEIIIIGMLLLLLFSLISLAFVAERMEMQHRLDMIRTCHEAGGYMVSANTCVYSSPFKP